MLDTFATFQPARPDPAALRADYAALLDGLRLPPDEAWIHAWEDLSQTTLAWCNWADLRYYLDTRDPDATTDREHAVQIRSLLDELDTGTKRQLLEAHPDVVEAAFGPRTRARWRLALNTWSPAVATDLEEEQRLVGRYVAHSASATVELHGAVVPLKQVVGSFDSEDRATREAAVRAYYGWYDGQRAFYDGLFDELVHLRTKIARTLGDTDATALSYRRMGRVDWGPAEAARFRSAILEDVVPLVAALRSRQARQLGLPRVRLWDEVGPLGPRIPAPTDLEPRLDRALDRFHAPLGSFFRELRVRGLYDLDPRDGKVQGGFTMTLDGNRWPFVFGNRTGSADDVRLILHELGHAYQLRTSALQRPRASDWLGSAETAEVHAMSLELLAFPVLDDVFGPEVDEVVRQSLVQAVAILPYTAAIDAFQHAVYAQPDASPDDRAQMWRDAENSFMPWRYEPDLPCVAAGRQWHRQGHVFFAPFYYLDYALARVAALQLWMRSRHDPEGARDAWQHLCEAGGSIGLDEMAKLGGFESPFDPGGLGAVVRLVEDLL